MGLSEQWKKNMPVSFEKGDDGVIKDFNTRNAVRGWLCYRKLHAEGRAAIGLVYGDENDSVKIYEGYSGAMKEKKKSLLDSFRELRTPPRKRAREWALENPYNFMLLIQSGADVILKYEDSPIYSGCYGLSRHVAQAEGRDVSHLSGAELDNLFYDYFSVADEQAAERLMQKSADRYAQLGL